MSTPTKESTSTESSEPTLEDREERLHEEWFSDRRSGSLPPPRKSSVPPMGDDEVDPWLR